MRRIAVIFLIALLFPVGIFAAATNATRISFATFFAPRSTNQTPDGFPSFWNSSTTMPTGIEVCNSTGSCYPLASPIPTPSPVVSADAGVTIGSGATTKVDTCSTGRTGTICYRLSDVVSALKASGQLAP